MNIYIKLMVIGVFSVSSVFVQAQTSEQVRNSNSLDYPRPCKNNDPDCMNSVKYSQSVDEVAKDSLDHPRPCKDDDPDCMNSVKDSKSVDEVANGQ
ncbi:MULTISPECIES: hypothetical protein [Vibrio]|uniref:hypothetical protein n=1 Tax=Vibrio TaxID=662 RepID=UPI001CDCA0DE|nr:MULTISPECIES: hypothetical protein [Vibrio]MCA2454837.1 hypothetical protein [Vibrio alginolyticus]MCA2460322.1 hypothetical protein [Vibrio alginolyticus]MDW2266707.1 hypothetical protein [Vibrio sp. 1394]MDW2293737.1 hypothetical protein [Vibrio sp. 1404]